MKKKKQSSLTFKIIAAIALLIIFSLGYLYLIPVKKTVSQTKTQTPEQLLLQDVRKTSHLPFSEPQLTAFEYRFDPTQPFAVNGYKIVASGTAKEFQPLGQSMFTLQEQFVRMGYTVNINNQADGPGSSQSGVQKDTMLCIIHTETPNIFKTPGCPNTVNYNDPGTCEALVEISCGTSMQPTVTK